MCDNALVSENRGSAGGGAYVIYGTIEMKGNSSIRHNIADFGGGMTLSSEGKGG